MDIPAKNVQPLSESAMRQNTKHSLNNRSNGRQKNGHYRPNHTHDANAADKRFRGTAHQMHEKYLSMAMDAVSAGNRIDAETYYQHADHFYRVTRGSFDDIPTRSNPAPVMPVEVSIPIQQPESQDIGRNMDVSINLPIVEAEE